MRRALVLVALPALACTSATAPTEAAGRTKVSLMSWKQGDAPRRGYVFTPGAADTPTPRVAMHRIIYMNRQGGSFTRGTTDNSSTNKSTVIDYYDSPGGTLSPWPFGDAKWNDLMNAVRAGYGAYDVEVTDVDPGPVPHVEIVVAGSPGEIGLPADCCLGIAPFACEPIEQAITYAFAAVHPNDTDQIAWTVLQETAHAFGLDHVLVCEDALTYLYDCGVHKEFVDVSGNCGEDTARACSCGGNTQNSVDFLNATLGPSGDTLPPNVDFTQPADGATVSPGFSVELAASDDVAVVSVDLYVDGSLLATDNAAPWQFTTPAELALGAHTVEVRAQDGKANIGTNQISVNISDGSDPGGEDPGGGDPGGDPGGGGNDDDMTLNGGCQVAHTPVDKGWLVLFALAVLALLAIARRATR